MNDFSKGLLPASMTGTELLRILDEERLRIKTSRSSRIRSVFDWLKVSLSSLWEPRPGQISSLDGLRAMAITLVVASHSKNDFIYAGGNPQPKWLFSILEYAWTGVDLFFVLSGFLIGKILFQEWKETGNVKVIPFLLRRSFRIWPLYYFVCLLSLTRLMFSPTPLSFGQILPDLSFLTNYYPEKLAFGTWSLSIEEQFYLIASLGIVVFRKKIKGSTRHITHLLLALFLSAPILRALTWRHFMKRGLDPFAIEWDKIHSFLHTHYDGLVMGLIFASLIVFSPKDTKKQEWVGPILTALVIISGALTVFSRISFLYSFAALGFGGAVWYCLRKPKSAIARAFSWRGFQVLSRLSYGIYLWYRFPLWKIARFVSDHFPNAAPSLQYLLIFLTAFGFAAVAATITYVFIERPFLELRGQLYRNQRA